MQTSLILHFWTHLYLYIYFFSCLLFLCPHQFRYSMGPQWHRRKKKKVVLTYLFYLHSLVYYLKQSQRTLSLMNSTLTLKTNKKTKQSNNKKKCQIFDLPPWEDVLSFALPLRAGCYKRGMRASEEGGENLIPQNGLTLVLFNIY